MKRKSWLSLLLVLMLAFAAFGCSNTSTSSGNDGGTSADGSGDKVELTLWYWNRSISDDLIAQVEEEFPHIKINAEKVGGDFKAKLMTSLAAGSGAPDLVGLNDWVAEFFPNADQFYNLYDLGAEEIQNQYLEWKWNQGVTPNGELIALPMDIGPTALFYRTDIFEAAGLPTDPAEVSAAISTWDDYLEAGIQVKNATDTYMVDNVGMVFNQVIHQGSEIFFNENDEFIGDQDHIKQAWDYAVKFKEAGISSNTEGWTPEWNAVMNNGDVASFVGAVWMKQVLKDAAPDTAGLWNVARAPGGDGNNGGSFLAIPKQSQHPEEAYEVAKWLLNPDNQIDPSYTEVDLFPSTPSAFEDERMAQPEEFFGGQSTGKIFMEAAKDVKPTYRGPFFGVANSGFGDELALVRTQDKDPQKAWEDAISQIKRELTR
jgi:cellobiose transport system substrate-binding protein